MDMETEHRSVCPPWWPDPSEGEAGAMARAKRFIDWVCEQRKTDEGKDQGNENLGN